MNNDYSIDLQQALLSELNKLQNKLLAGKGTPVTIILELTEYITEYTHSDYGFIIKVNHTDSHPSFQHIAAATSEQKIIVGTSVLPKQMLPIDHCAVKSLLNEVVTTNKALIHHEYILTETYGTELLFSATNLIAIPLVFEDTVLGILILLNDTCPYHPETVSLLEPALSTCAAICMNMAREVSFNDNDLFSLLIENSSDILTILNSDGTIRYESPAFYKVFGYTKSQVIGKNVFGFLHPEDVEKVMNVFTNALHIPGENAPVEFRFATVSGEYIILEAIGNNMLAHKAIQGIIVTSRNITERKRIETELRNSKAHLSALVDAFPQADFLLDKDYKIIKLNALARKYIQLVWKKEGQEGESMLNYSNPKDLPYFQNSFKRAYAGERISYERELRYANGLVLWFELQYMPVYNISGEIYAVSFIAYDITSRKKNELELSKLSLVAKHTDNAVIITDKNGIIEWVNEGFVRISGYSFEEAIGQKPGKLLQGPLTEPEKVSYMSQCIANGESFKTEIINYNKNGRHYWLSISVSPVYDEAGNISRFIAIESDISDRKQLEHKLFITQHSVQHASEGIVWISEKGNIIAANKTICQLLNHTEYELLQLEIQNFSTSLFSQDWNSYWLELQQKQNDNFEIQYTSEYGVSYVLEINTSYFKVEDFAYAVAFVRDITERKNLEKATRQYLGTLHAIQESSDHIIFALDTQYRYLSFNSMYARIVKRDNGSDIIIGMEVAKVMQKKWPYLKKHVDFALQGEQYVAIEEIYTASTKHYYEVSYNPIRPLGNEVVGVAIFALDITHKLEVEQSFRKAYNQLENYKNALDRSALISIKDLSGKLIHVNEFYCTVSKYSYEELVGKHYSLVHADSHSRAFYANMWQILQEGKLWRGEIKNQAKDGSFFWVDTIINPIYDEQGKLVQFLTIMYETTNRKKAEEKIIENEAFLKDTQQVALIGNWEIRLPENKLIWSDSTFFIHGLDISKGAPTPEELPSLYHPDDYAILHQEALLARQRGDSYNVDVRILLPDGTTKYVNIIGKSIVRPDGKFTRLQGTIMDIDDRKKNELRLAKQNEELTKLNTELDRFVYSVSHNLRAPLTSILGLINITKFSTESETLLKYLSLMEKSIHKLDATIHEINDYSRNARLEVEREEIDFEKLFKGIIENHAYMEGASKINIELLVSASSGFYSDKSRLLVILNNLLSNAIKYHDFDKASPFIKIQVTVDSAGAHILIGDNGLGIDSQYQEKVFDMFFRASNQATGSGLGLYIVKESVSKLQGTISLQSEPDQGTTFTIILPHQH